LPFLRELRRIKREFVLPDALDFLDQHGAGYSPLADWFSHWRARYFFGLILLGFVITCLRPALGIGWLILACIIDYAAKRSLARKHFQRQLIKLKCLLGADGYTWDKKRIYQKTREDHKQLICRKSPINRIKRQTLENLIRHHFQKNFLVLDAGCRDGTTLSPALKNGLASIGLDINRSDCSHYKKRYKRPCVQGNIEAMPFKNEALDAVILVEVIEHLFNPLQGIEEITRILKPGGRLVLSTDNRNRIGLMDLFNPLIVIERLVGLRFRNVLPPRNIFWEYGDHVKFYHTSFSKTELVELLRGFGLVVRSCRSYFFLPGLHEVVGKIWPETTAEDYMRLTYPIEAYLSKLPLIRWLGGHWLLLVQKP